MPGNALVIFFNFVIVRFATLSLYHLITTSIFMDVDFPPPECEV